MSFDARLLTLVDLLALRIAPAEIAFTSASSSIVSAVSEDLDLAASRGNTLNLVFWREVLRLNRLQRSDQTRQ